MSRVSDLVQDAELQTRFHPEYTVHIYTETGSSVRERAILREEYWKRQKFLGGGSYGSVWLEQCVEGEREVKVRAVKEVVKSPHASKQVDHNRELEAISKFSHRKYERCFVKSFGWYENENAVFIAMEYCEHGDLHHYLHLAPSLPETDAQQITFQVLEGLNFMHENGYSHRDLKPGNILVRSKTPDPWWVKLSDFGISKRAANNLAASSTLKGTLRYMAPELFGFGESSEGSDTPNAQAADMWALGEIAFQMLTKEPTFKNMSLLSTYMRSPGEFPSAVLRRHNVSEVGVNFINSMMQPKPEDRWTTSKALHQAWMEPYNSHSTEKTSFLSAEPILSKAIPAIPLGQSLSTPSGRWSTVSMAAPQSRSSTTIPGTAVRESSTLGTTINFSETNTSPLGSVRQGTARRVHSADQARYFILKSNNETNIETSSAHGIWCCGKNTNSRLTNAYNTTIGPIFLIFSVNQSRKFCGVAQMKSRWSPDVTTVHWEDGTWEGGFHVEWLSWNPIEFDDVTHLKHKEDNGVSISRGRFVLELCASTGMEMMERFGISDLVPQPTQQPSDMSMVGSLGVGRLGLTTNTGIDGSNTFEPMFFPESAGRQGTNLETMYSSTSTNKRPFEMEIDDSEDDKRQRI